MKFRIAQKGKKVLFESLLVFLFMFCSIDTLLFGVNGNDVFVVIGSIVLLILAGYLGFSSRGGLKKCNIKLMSVLLFLTFGTMLTVGEINYKYFYVMLLIILAAFYCSIFSLDTFVHRYCSVMYLLSVSSIIVFIVHKIVPWLVYLFPEVITSIGYSYYHMGVATVMQEVSGAGTRSYGIFREPGVYVVFLLLALIFSLFFLEKMEKRQVISYILAVFLTFSTTGYVLLMVLTLIFVLSKSKGNAVVRNAKYFVVIIVFFIAIYLIFIDRTNVIGVVFNKLFGTNISKNSRLDAFYVNVRMSFSRPLYAVFGNGFSYVESNFLSTARRIKSIATDNTNTVFRIMATQGILYAGIICGCWWKMFRMNLGVKKCIPVFILFIVALFTENLMLNPIMFILVFYGMMNLKVEREYAHI